MEGGTPLEIIRVGIFRPFLTEKQQYFEGVCGGCQRGTSPGGRQNSQHQQFKRPVHHTLRGAASVQVSWSVKFSKDFYKKNEILDISETAGPV